MRLRISIIPRTSKEYIHSAQQAGEHKVTLKNYEEINLYNCTEKLVGKSNVILINHFISNKF